jgi:predicted Zn-dependent protease
MKKAKILLLVFVAALMASCGTTNVVPITGRKQNLLVTDEQVLSLSNTEYTNYMKTAKASTNAANTAMVRRVGQRLANAVVSYLKANGMSNEVKNYAWEFNLVQNNEANAFCMPGGKIVVYEGLLPYTKDEASLAIVLGHEIAHAVAKHSAEQLSTQMKQQYGAQILSGVLSSAGVGSGASQIAQLGFGLGSKFSSLHYSRKNESEADYMGLVFAAMAGYDPNVAISFWQRMSSGNQNGTPAFLSDHPSDSKRIADIQKELPTALKYYKSSGTSTNSYGSSSKSGKSSKSGTKNPKRTTRTVNASNLH